MPGSANCQGRRLSVHREWSSAGDESSSDSGNGVGRAGPASVVHFRLPQSRAILTTDDDDKQLQSKAVDLIEKL